MTEHTASTSPELRRWRRSVTTNVIVALIAAAAAAAVYTQRIIPLSESGSPPQGQTHLAWAGPSLKGFGETVFVRQASCSSPTRIAVNLSPQPGVRLPSPGEVSMAIRAGAGIPSTPPALYVSKSVEVSQRLAYEDRLPSIAQTAYHGQLRPDEALLRFRFDPRSRRPIWVGFLADWTIPRGDGTCWLDLPSLFDDADTIRDANEYLGRPSLAEGPEGQPLINGAELLNFEAPSSVQVLPTASLPTPTKLQPVSWDCHHAGGEGGNCKSYAALETPGADSRRLRALSIWSVVAGVLLAILGEALVSLLKDVAVDRRPNAAA